MGDKFGIIYRITDTTNGFEYHGLSTDSLANRKKSHKHQAKLNAMGIAEGCRKLYHAMNAHGFEKFVFELVETVPISQLGEREKYWIARRNSIHPNGYNLTTGGEHHQHNDETKRLISEKCKKNEYSIGLPMYVTHKPRIQYHSFRITGHPLCNHKEFSENEYGSVENAKNACVNFLKELEEKGEKYISVPNKKDPTLSKGISKLKNGGYRVGKTYNGILHEKIFKNKSWSDEQQRTAAEKYLKDLEDKFPQI